MVFADLHTLDLSALVALRSMVAGERYQDVQAAIDRKVLAEKEEQLASALRGGKKKRGRPEWEEQQEIKKSLTALAIRYYDTSQPFRALVTPGVPDLLCFCPRRGFFVIEAKAPGGKQSDAQREFQGLCEAAGIPYVCGDRHAVNDYLARTA